MDDSLFHNKQSIMSISAQDRLKHHLCVDAKVIYDIISTLHECGECRPRQTVERIRDSFKFGELDCIRWVQGKENISDALTKPNPQMHRLFN